MSSALVAACLRNKSVRLLQGLLSNGIQGLLSNGLPVLPNVDWSQYAGPVRDQQKCGSCFALATVNSLEALYSMKFFGGIYLEFSTQQIIDCAMYNYNGCRGGLLEWSYDYMETHGITTAFAYPYTSGVTGTASVGGCNKGKSDTQFKVESYRMIRGDCVDLRRTLQQQPVAVGIAGINLQFYTSGIFDGCDQSPVLDHAVLLVGFNNSYGWRIKNSWGVKWGEQGYGWITATGNNCGICNLAAVPTIAI